MARLAAMGIVICASLFLGLLVLQEIGRRLGRARLARDPESRPGVSPVESAILALLGLLVAFTFNGAASRYDGRRALVAQEANAIGTAYLRLDLLAAERRDSLRGKFRRYLSARIAVYRALPDMEAAYAGLARSQAVQQEIWAEAVPASVAAGGAAPMLLLGAINTMIDITTTRLVATQTHPPLPLYVMLGLLTLLSGLLAGYTMAMHRLRPLLHMFVYAATVSIAVYIILDLEYPRLGLIRVEGADQVLIDLLEQMNAQR